MTKIKEIPQTRLSEAQIRLIEDLLSDIPGGGAIESYPFDEETVTTREDAYLDVLDESSTNYNWRRFFDEQEGGWVLNEEELVLGWCATLVDVHPLEVVSIEGSSVWTVKAETDTRGTISFNLYFDAEELLKADPKPSEGKFLVWFVEPESGDPRDFVYPWSQVGDDSFWESVRRSLITNQRAPDISITEQSSNAVQRNKDGVKDSLREISEHHDATVLNQPHTHSNIQKADAELSINDVYFAAEIENETHLLFCECSNVSSETIHAHLIRQGEAVDPESVEEAKKIINHSHNKVRRYNDLFDDQDRSNSFLKLATGLGAVGLAPLLSNLVNPPSGAETWLANNFQLIIAGVLVIAVILLIYSILPLVRLRQFSWDSPKYEDFVDSVKLRIPVIN